MSRKDKVYSVMDDNLSNVACLSRVLMYKKVYNGIAGGGNTRGHGKRNTRGLV